MKDIVDGYKGIMDLDLTNIEEGLKKQLAEQHTKDIDNYKMEQAKLSPRLRYENTIERIRKLHQYDNEKQKKRTEIQREERGKHNELYNSRQNYITYNIHD
jgi:hypothetical protein|tara:strand:- start:453 stop:755 length:303 start_codon:yes stop_codon:yes gene_type:complete